MSRRQTVLLVDDDERFLTQAEQALAQSDYHVLTAPDGAAALDLVGTVLPDVVITDLEMPQLDGLGLCRALRELRAFDGVPLVLCTHATSDDARVIQARALAQVIVVHKPIENHELATLTDVLLGGNTVGLQGRANLGPAWSPQRREGQSGLLARINARREQA